MIAITPKTTNNKNELPATRIHRQCNPKAIEVAFLSVPAIQFFAQDQLLALQEWYLASGQGLEPVATVKDDRGPLPSTFLLQDVWIFGCTKPTSEVTAVAQPPSVGTSWPRHLQCSSGCGRDGRRQAIAPSLPVRTIVTIGFYPLACHGRTLPLEQVAQHSRPPRN